MLDLDPLRLLSDPAPGEEQEWLSLAYHQLPIQPIAPRLVRRYLGRDRARTRKAHSRKLKCVLHPLYVSPEGNLELARPRLLRESPEGSFQDLIFDYQPAQPNPLLLQRVRQRISASLTEAGYRDWEKLDATARRALIRLGGTPEQALRALSHSPGPKQAECLALFYSAQAHPQLRLALTEVQGGQKAQWETESLSWALSQKSWNRDPDLVRLARQALTQNPQSGWELTGHPDPRLRKRLLGLLPPRQDWLDWLARETEPGLRRELLLRLQQEHSCKEMVDRLVSSKRAEEKRVLGWVLAHWPKITSRDRRHLRQALKSGLGQEHTKLLRSRLRSSRSSWLPFLRGSVS